MISTESEEVAAKLIYTPIDATSLTFGRFHNSYSTGAPVIRVIYPHGSDEEML